MKLTENARLVYDYVKAHDGQDFTAQDIADATGLARKSVDGIVTSAFQRKKLMYREPAEVEVTTEDGKVKHQEVKFVRLTDDGRDLDPNAED